MKLVNHKTTQVSESGQGEAKYKEREREYCARGWADIWVRKRKEGDVHSKSICVSALCISSSISFRPNVNR